MGARRLLCAALFTTLAAATACGAAAQHEAATEQNPQATADAAFASLISRSTDLGPAAPDAQLSISLRLKDDTAAARQHDRNGNIDDIR